jgi:hypothetical protein
VWKRETITMKEAVEIVSKEGCNRGVLLGLKRA